MTGLNVESRNAVSARTHIARAKNKQDMNAHQIKSEHIPINKAAKNTASDLKDSDRTLLMFFYISGMTEPEIAEEMSLSLNAVKSRLVVAREKLLCLMAPNET